MGQNFNRSEPSLEDIVWHQLRVNLEVGKKLHAIDRILECIDNKMNNFTVAVQNQLNFNKVLEMRIAQLATTLPHPNDRDFPGQPAVPIKKNLKAVITRSRKTMAKLKTNSKKMGPTDLVKEEEKSRPRLRQNRGLRMKKKTLVRLRPRASVIHTCYNSPIKQRSLWKMKNSITSWKQFKNVHPHSDAGRHQVPTYARYLKDILNQM
jgi:hypothetical protein